jgi:hypothetical protein
MPEPIASCHQDSFPPLCTTDRRAAVRYLAENTTRPHAVGKPHDICLSARIHDISCHGIGLIFAESVAKGTILNVELHGKEQRLPYFLLARVVWTKRGENGMHMAGCQFARPLTEAELHELL